MSTKRVKRKKWPILTSYDQEHLRKIAMPIGGIGTGTVSLGGRGDLRDWEIQNRPAKNFTPGFSTRVGPFFAIFAKPPGQKSVAKLLEGPIDREDYEGSGGCAVKNHGFPRFRKCSFDAAYPLGQVNLDDTEMPVKATLQAFNPMIPGDAENSGIPVAVLRYVVTNKTKKSIDVSVCAGIPNLNPLGPEQNDCGQGKEKKVDKRRSTLKKSKNLRGIIMTSEYNGKNDSRWGSLAISTDAQSGITSQTKWICGRWNEGHLSFWDEFSTKGKIKNPNNEDTVSAGILAVSQKIPARGCKEFTFLLTWHFPYRQAWAKVTDCCSGKADKKENTVGNYYTTVYKDAWEVAEKTIKVLPKLEEKTVEFVQSFCASNLPHKVKEAALFNTSTIRTETCFRTADGRFYGWEGCCDGQGCCHGSCTHVWNYEQATAFLFGNLACCIRDNEFNLATDNDGLMSFRINLPIKYAQQFGRAAADGQMGCIMKMYRDWQLSGNEKLLQKLWPKVRKSLEFCWVKGGWDGDRDGVMEGSQHNTMDVEYYGPNPQMGVWYLGALRAAEEMALYVGEKPFAEKCRKLFARGKTWIDKNLFNGDYYEHKIKPIKDVKKIHKGLLVGMGSKDMSDPDFQLGSGCLVDQLVGQYFAHVCGLGYLLDPGKVKKTLNSIMKYNFKTGFHHHFNHCRSYALGDESAILMATYPKGRRPKVPFPYCNEVMTGFEYTAAIHMLYEGQMKNGLKAIEAIRERYDGKRRSPFDEAECGHHYARAMASWAAVTALTGFHYSGVEKSISFAPQAGNYFWSNGYAWGNCSIKKSGSKFKVELTVLHGKLQLKKLTLKGIGENIFDKIITIGEMKKIRVTM